MLVFPGDLGSDQRVCLDLHCPSLGRQREGICTYVGGVAGPAQELGGGGNTGTVWLSRWTQGGTCHSWRQVDTCDLMGPRRKSSKARRWSC